MSQSVAASLEGARVLVLEDEFLIADDLARALRDAGAVPIGPVNSVEAADELIGGGRVDAAILDLNLNGKMAFGLAERVIAADLPCLVVSGYGRDALPEELADMPRIEKPADPRRIVTSLADQIAVRST